VFEIEREGYGCSAFGGPRVTERFKNVGLSSRNFTWR